MTATRVRIPGPLAEQRMGNKLYRVEVVAHMTFDLVATSEQDAEFLARRCARGVVYNEEICQVLAKPVNLLEQMKSDNLKGWLEGEAYKLLTPEQQSRSDAGQLAEAELLHVAREEIFSGIEISRWKPLRWGDIEHCIGCTATAQKGHIPMDVRTHQIDMLGGADPQHGAALGAGAAVIRHRWVSKVNAKVKISIMCHVVTCRICTATRRRLSASISVPFAGRMLTREYAL